MKRICAALSLGILVACGGTSDAPESPVTTEAKQVTASNVEEVQSSYPHATALSAAVSGDWRSKDESARDAWRNPEETLAFLGVEPNHTVIEIWPGRGWYTNILAPYLNSGGGKFIAAVWDVEAMTEDRRERYDAAINRFRTYFEANPEVYGTLGYTALSDTSGPLGEPNSVDVVLTFRNVHNWMANGYEAKVFEDAFAVLKPGGVLGVVEHRLPSSDVQDPLAKSGYVHEDYVKSLAANSGFLFDAASDINANPADDADHPFGVWTLQPASRSEDRDGNAPEGFDPAEFAAIGESDRMTLRFVKPIPEE